jgi:hypothetical protein
MIDRCENPNSHAYKDYGARGIKVCQEWHSFDNFIKDMGNPKGLTIERINNDLGYSKDNCKWATMKEQSRNRRSNRIITYNGESLSIIEWAERFGMAHDCLSYRLKKWGVCDAAFKKEVHSVTTPIHVVRKIKDLLSSGCSYSEIKAEAHTCLSVISKVKKGIHPSQRSA